MPKHIQQTLMGIFAALALGSFLFFSYRALGSSPGVQDIAGLIVTSVAILLLHRLEGLKGTLEDIGDTLLGKLAKIEAYQAAVSSASTSVSYAGIESPVESQRERLRREREQILVHGAAETIANHPGQAREVANGIKAFLSELDDGVAPKWGAAIEASIDVVQQQTAAAAAQGDDAIEADPAPRWPQGQAPRVTMEMVNEQIVGETYTVLPSGRVTVCELTLKNGFTVRGESAVVFIENNVPQTGREIARKKAADQIWQLLGYELRSKLAADQKAA